jgi:thiol-disulfide isomerase/thioredoxin
MPLQRAAAIGVLVVGTFFLLVAAARYVQPERPTARAAATPAPEAEPGAGETIRFFKNPATVALPAMTDLDGRALTPESLRGKVVLVNFWATWCPPCREEIPDLIKLQDRYRDTLVVVGISQDSIAPQEVKAFGKAHGMNYPIVMETEAIDNLFPAVSALPTSFFIDREGKLVKKHVGMLNASVTDLEARSLAGLPVKASVELVEEDDKVRLENAAQANKIPGIDLAPLTPAQKNAVLQKLNTEKCTCGCRLTVAQCRVDDPTCPVSLPLAKEMVKKITKS